MTQPATMPPLAGKRALVIGAGTPAGQIAARALANAGADVALASTSLDGVEVMATRRVRRAVEALGRRSAEYVFDLSLPTNVRVSTRQVAKEMGGLDLLVNAADMFLPKEGAQTSDAEWSRVMNVNLFGVFYACRSALGEMHDAGHIITISSTLGAEGAASSAAYAAARHGVVGLIRALAADCVERRVSLNVIELPFAPPPGTAEATLSYDAARLLAAEPELAGLVLRLASLEGAGVTGQVFRLDLA